MASPRSVKRGEIVAVAAAGDYGKPRPAVVVQSDAFPDSHESVIICQMTSALIDAPHFRLVLQPNELNGLRVVSQIMIDKPGTVRRERLGATIGHLNRAERQALDSATGLRHRSGRLKKPRRSGAFTLEPSVEAQALSW